MSVPLEPRPVCEVFFTYGLRLDFLDEPIGSKEMANVREVGAASMQTTEQRIPSGAMDAQLDDLEEQVRIAFQEGKRANWRSVWDGIRSAGTLHKQVWFESVEKRRRGIVNFFCRLDRRCRCRFALPPDGERT